LWALSALAVLLLHSAALVCLFLRPQPRLRMPGSPQALNIELAPLPASSSPLALQPIERQKLPPREPEHPARVPLADTTALQPLAQMQPIAQQLTQTSSHEPSSRAAAPEVAPALAPVADPELPAADLASKSETTSSAGDWLEQVKARLEQYKQYPVTAVRHKQQDTVTLRFSVDRAGRITHLRIDSRQHYSVLEGEVRKMLQLAGPLPVPPAEVPVDQVTWDVPVAFSLTSSRSAPLPGCAAPADPGPAPPAATATLIQIRSYRERLEKYLAASSAALKCGGSGAESQSARDAQIRQLRTLIANFNAQVRAFEARAQAQALQAQQLRQRQLQALATQTYASCTPPSAVSAPASPPGAAAAIAYGRQLTAYQAALRTYIACVLGRHLAATAAERNLPAGLAAELDVTAATLTNGAILRFNQLVVPYNAQVEALRDKASGAGAQDLAETLVRAPAIFPDSSWSVPAPLPADECLRIIRTGQGYRAELCKGTYVTRAGVSTGSLGGSSDAPGDATIANVTQIEAIAAEHGVAGDPRGGPPILGTAIAPLSQANQQTFSRTQVAFYTVKNLQVKGRRVSVTVAETSLGASGQSQGSSSVQFQLALSADGHELRGLCSTVQRRWICTLIRHP